MLPPPAWAGAAPAESRAVRGPDKEQTMEQTTRPPRSAPGWAPPPPGVVGAALLTVALATGTVAPLPASAQARPRADATAAGTTAAGTTGTGAHADRGGDQRAGDECGGDQQPGHPRRGESSTRPRRSWCRRQRWRPLCSLHPRWDGVYVLLGHGCAGPPETGERHVPPGHRRPLGDQGGQATTGPGGDDGCPPLTDLITNGDIRGTPP